MVGKGLANVVGFDEASSSRAVVAEYTKLSVAHDSNTVASSSKKNPPHVGEAIGLGEY
jgi:hypothetical protein